MKRYVRIIKLENYEEISGNSIAEDFTFKEMYYQRISALVLSIDSLKIYRNLKEVQESYIKHREENQAQRTNESETDEWNRITYIWKKQL